MAQFAIMTAIAVFCMANIDFFVALAAAGGVIWLGASLACPSGK